MRGEKKPQISKCSQTKHLPFPNNHGYSEDNQITINIIVVHSPLTSSYVSFINHGCFALAYNYFFIIILREDLNTLIDC